MNKLIAHFGLHEISNAFITSSVTRVGVGKLRFSKPKYAAFEVLISSNS